MAKKTDTRLNLPGDFLGTVQASLNTPPPQKGSKPESRRKEAPRVREYEYYMYGPDSEIEVSYHSQPWVLCVRARSAARAKALIQAQTVSPNEGAEGIYEVRHSHWDYAKKNWPWSFSVDLLA